MRTSATNRRLRVILTELREGRLVPDPAFQRRLVWSNRHKVAFLETVLAGLPFPEIFIAAGPVNPDTGEGKELIVDGQQRATTLFQYFTGSPDLSFGRLLTPYARLENFQKLEFLEYEVVVRDLGSLTEDQTRDLFYRINSTSYALNAMEVNNARYDGELKRFCDQLSTNDFFEEHRIFSAIDVKRMNDVRWCLTLIITMLSSYFNRDSEHQAYLEQYNDYFSESEDIASRIQLSLDRIGSFGFARRSRVWQKADLFTLVIELDRLRNNLSEQDLVDAGENLHGFYSRVDSLISNDRHISDDLDFFTPLEDGYYTATRSGVNDRSSRIRRGEIIREVIQLPRLGA